MSSNLQPKPQVHSSISKTAQGIGDDASNRLGIKTKRAGAAIYIGIFLTSASVLLFQLALTRVFAVLLWAHLAFMVVSTALFGFGLSGVYLALRKKLQSDIVLPRLGALCGVMAVAMLGTYLIITNVPFRMWQFHTDPINYLYLAIWYVALVVPFFIAGLIIASLLTVYKTQSSKLYGVDLIGAAVGSLLLVPVIPTIGGEGTIVLSAILAGLAGVFYLPAKSRITRLALVLILCSLGVILPKAQEVLPIRMHETKRRFNQAVNYDHIYATRWSPLSRVDIAYHRDNILDIWIDGGTNESAILKWNGNLANTKPMTFSTIGAVYDLRQNQDPNVLIIGPSGGKEVLFALSHGAAHVDAVEMDPSIVALVNEERYASFMGGLYQHEKVTLINDEGRSFVKRQPEESYDIIQFVNNYTPIAMASGALNLSAAFLLTKEAINDYLDRLTPNGILALHRGATLRLATMVKEVLAERGIANPESHIVISSGEVPYFDGFFLKKTPFTNDEVARLDSYLQDRPLEGGRTLLWNPIAKEGKGLYKELLTAPVEDLPKYYTSLGVNLFPSTDDRPFIEHFLQLGNGKLSPKLPSEFHNRNKEKWRGSIPRGDFPYVAILAESAVLALLFVFFPLFFFAKSSLSHKYFRNFLLYFSCLGFGFIVVEICLMKKYVLFLGNPAYSITTVLVMLLCGAGLGSIYTSRFSAANARNVLCFVLPAIALGLLSETYIAPLVFEQFLAKEFATRVAISGALLLPVGFLLGMAFPLGLQLIDQTTTDDERQKILAWAWGINGYTTVIGSAATVFIAVFAGFTVALNIAMFTYLLAMVAVLPMARRN